MPSIFVYEQTGRYGLAALLKPHGFSLTTARNPEEALSYCNFAEKQFGVIVLEMDRLNFGAADRSGHELIFFHSISLLPHGTPIILVAPDPSAFLHEFEQFGFKRIVEPEYLMEFLACKKSHGEEHCSLGEYDTYVVGVQAPVNAPAFVRLIEMIYDDVLHTPV